MSQSVNSPSRSWFLVLGAGDRGASSCLFSSLCSVVSDNIWYSLIWAGRGGMCWKLVVVEEGTKRVFNCLHHYVHFGSGISVTLSGLPCFVPSYYDGEPDTFAALNNVENRARALFNEHFFCLQ